MSQYLNYINFFYNLLSSDSVCRCLSVFVSITKSFREGAYYYSCFRLKKRLTSCVHVFVRSRNELVFVIFRASISFFCCGNQVNCNGYPEEKILIKTLVFIDYS